MAAEKWSRSKVIRVGGGALLGTVLWPVIGCETPTPQPTVTPEPTPSPKPIEKPTGTISFSFSESIPNDQKTEIRNAATQVLSWLHSKTEAPLAGVTVFGDDNPERIVDFYLSRTSFPEDVKAAERKKLLAGATAWPGRNNDLYINTVSRGWTSASPIVGGPIKEGRIHTVAHELLHLVQMRSGSHTYPFPFWLWEGSAHYVAAQFLGEKNIYPYQNIVSAHMKEATPMREPLESLESPEFYRAGNPFADEFSLGFLATKHLTRGLPNGGVKELVRFWDEVGKGTAWREAFQKTFGKSTQEFYSGFEASRQQGFK